MILLAGLRITEKFLNDYAGGGDHYQWRDVAEDVIDYILGCYGGLELYAAHPGVQQTGISATPGTKLTIWDTALPYRKVTASPTTNDITIDADMPGMSARSDGVYRVDFNISFSGDENTAYHFHLFKNGVNTTYGCHLLARGPEHEASAGFSIHVPLKQGDVIYVDVHVEVGSGKVIDVEHATLSVSRIGLGAHE